MALKLYEYVHPWLIVLTSHFTATPAPYSPYDILQHQFYGAQTYFIWARSWRCPLLSANSCVSRLSNSCRRVSRGLQVLQRKACAVCRDSSLCSSLPTWNMCVFQESVCYTAWLYLQIIFKVNKYIRLLNNTPTVFKYSRYIVNESYVFIYWYSTVSHCVSH